jgi:hypothetical protein
MPQQGCRQPPPPRAGGNGQRIDVQFNEDYPA